MVEILFLLLNKNDKNKTQISKLIKRTQATINREVKTLTDLGLLEAKRKKKNRKEFIINLTKKGLIVTLKLREINEIIK